MIGGEIASPAQARRIRLLIEHRLSQTLHQAAGSFPTGDVNLEQIVLHDAPAGRASDQAIAEQISSQIVSMLTGLK
jgi:hypothetical protein